MSPTATENAVTELLHRLAEHARTEPSAPGPVVAQEPERRRPARALGVAAALVVVAVLASVSLVVRDDGRHRVVTGDQPGTLPGGTTERLAAAGLAGRSGASWVWTGSELLVWGGSTGSGSANRWLADGAALAPVANRWRPLPPAPIGPRSDAAAVWTGEEMLVWGGTADDQLLADGAAFDPQANRWRTIAPRPFGGASRPAVVWTGTEMLVVSSTRTSAYDPGTDRWRALAAPPGDLVMPYPQVVWTGNRAVLVLWGDSRTSAPIGSPFSPAVVEGPGPVAATTAPSPSGTPPPPPPGPPPVPSRGGPNSGMFLASYSPESDRWARLPEVALEDGGLPRLVWTGREVLVLQRSLPSAAFDVARQAWRTLAPVPSEPSIAADPVWTGRFALFWGGGEDGLAYDPAADAWSAFDAGGLSRRSDAVVAWTGRLLVGWGGFSDDGSGRREDDGIRYRPPSP